MTLPRAVAGPAAAAALVDQIAFHALTRSLGLTVAVAHCASLALATPLAFVALSRWQRAARGAGVPLGRRAARFAGLSVLALLLRGGPLAEIGAAGWSPAAALLASELAAAAVFAGGALAWQRAAESAEAGGGRAELAILAIGAYLVGLRVAYLGAIELIAQEAYYWNYARHLAWSYLDHPPLVAWGIAASTALLGNGEAAVRLPALLSWLVAAVFVDGYARDLFGRRAARFTLLLFTLTPFFFLIGFLITPDSPLVACWAAALFGLHRALVTGERRAWGAVGIAMGLGLLSKYTMALLAPAAIVFAASDANARRRLLGARPLAAALLALLLFTPVLAWNADHGWVSFRFQGPARFQDPIRSPLDPGYAVHWLKSLFQLTVATGILPLLLLAPGGPAWKALDATPRARANRRFVLIFSAVPALVFVAYAFWEEPHANWMGPVWLALLPVLGAATARLIDAASGRAARALALLVTCVVLAYAAGLHGLALGIPGLPLPAAAARLVAWRDVGDAVAGVECRLLRERGRRPLVIGGDKYNESSLLAYYDGRGARTACGGDLDAREISARHLFHRQSLMYEFWSTPAQARGRDVVLVSRIEDRLRNRAYPGYFARMDEPEAVPIRRGGAEVARFWYRVGYDFRLPPGTPPSSLAPLAPEAASEGSD